jgi:hypothetical protein
MNYINEDGEGNNSWKNSSSRVNKGNNYESESQKNGDASGEKPKAFLLRNDSFGSL